MIIFQDFRSLMSLMFFNQQIYMALPVIHDLLDTWIFTGNIFWLTISIWKNILEISIISKMYINYKNAPDFLRFYSLMWLFQV